MGQPKARGLFLAMSALALAACTTTETTETTEKPKPPATPTSSAERLPGDRDERAVFAALREIDMCALLDAASDVDPTFANLPPKAYGPDDCTIAVDKAEGHTLHIRSGVSEPVTRKSRELVTLGDAKAYESTGTSPNRCGIMIPISFRLGVGVHVTNPDRAGYENCVPARQVATAVTKLLADPAAARREPIWDQCTLLAGARHEPLARHVNCMSILGPLDLSYFFVDNIGRPDTVGDMPVLVDESTDCTISWRIGPAPSPYAVKPDFAATATQTDCDKAKRLVADVVRMMAAPPPTDVAPQHPLLYKPNERDKPE